MAQWILQVVLSGSYRESSRCGLCFVEEEYRMSQVGAGQAKRTPYLSPSFLCSCRAMWWDGRLIVSKTDVLGLMVHIRGSGLVSMWS